MLEFWCVVIFLALSLATVGLIEVLDRMMGVES